MAFWSRLFGLGGGKEQPERKTYGHILDPFIYDGELLSVSSTNVLFIQYHIDDHKMMIEYKNGRAYLYSPILPYKAAEFALTASVGGKVWDDLRVRGPGGDAHAAPGIKVQRIK